MKNLNRERFKSHLRKIGSGEHTSKGLTREESADALELMLQNVPTPAQIGAFMIAHRIRRPEPQELAGMIDTYLKLGPIIKSRKTNFEPLCFGMPLDGRTKTSPIYPLTTLILLDAGQPVVLHSAENMPTKYGVSSLQLFQALGLPLHDLTISQVQDGFHDHGFALINQSDHFQLANSLIPYREEIGKRPPIASMELLWTAHKGRHLLVTGFVHPPTEKRHLQTLQLLGEKHAVTVKGLEGSTDLPLSRQLTISELKNEQIKNFTLSPKEHHCHGKDVAWHNISQWKEDCINTLNGKGAFQKALIWNAGIYLWLTKSTNSISKGIKKAEESIISGSAQKTLNQLIQWRKTIN